MKRTFLLIPHLKIHNANAMSSPFTIGFPAMTAWLGAVHAIERKLHANGINVQLSKVAVSCHHFDLQTYKGKSDYVHSIVGTANPLDKDGSRPAFIEEARCHLEVSLLIELDGFSKKIQEKLLEFINNLVMRMKFASGDVLSSRTCELLSLDEDSDTADFDLKKMLHKLMLGNVLVERKDLVIESMNEGKDAIDSILEYLTVNHHPNPVDSDSENDKANWTVSRKTSGWIVPIAVGYQGLSPISHHPILNQRDDETPHRFAESIVTLGEFIMPYRAKSIDHVLWEYHVDLENDLYLCRNQI